MESVWQLKPWRREQGNFMVHLLTFRVVGLWSLALLRAERSQRGVSCHMRVRFNAIVARVNSTATFGSPRIRNRRIPRCSFKMPKTGSASAFRRRYKARPVAEHSLSRMRRCAGWRAGCCSSPPRCKTPAKLLSGTYASMPCCSITSRLRREKKPLSALTCRGRSPHSRCTRSTMGTSNPLSLSSRLTC